MDNINYILIKGERYFECKNLLEVSTHFDISVTKNKEVICDNLEDTISYSKDWNAENIIMDFMKSNRIVKMFPAIKLYKVIANF